MPGKPNPITRGRVAIPRRILLHGVEGVGKSTFGANAPNAVFIPTERSTEDIDVYGRFPLADTFAKALEWLDWLCSEDHDYKTVVIDSADWLERLIHKNVAQRCGVPHIAQAGGGYGKGYEFALDEWADVTHRLNYLDTHKGMTSILVAHTAIVKVKDADCDNYDQFQPRLQDKASHYLREWATEVLFARWKTFTHTEDLGHNKTTVKAAGTGQRILHTQYRPSAVAKNRINGLPAEMPFEWSEFAKYLGGAQRNAETPAAVAA